MNAAWVAKGLKIFASRAMNKQKRITFILNLITRKSPWDLFSRIFHSYKFETLFSLSFFLLHGRMFTRSWVQPVIYQMRKGRRWLLGTMNSNVKCPFLTFLRGRWFTRNLPRVSKHTVPLEVKPWQKDDLEAAAGLALGGGWPLFRLFLGVNRWNAPLVKLLLSAGALSRLP